MRCLDTRLDHVGATVSALRSADDESVAKAVEAVEGLPKLEHCADLDALMAELPPPADAELAARVDALDEQLVEAEAFDNLGHHDEGFALTAAVKPELEGIDYGPLEVRFHLVEGALNNSAGNYEQAGEAYRQAYELALDLRMIEQAARAASWKIMVHGYYLDDPVRGRRWAERAEPLIRIARAPTVEAMYFNSLGALTEREGHYEVSLEHHRRALTISEAELGAEDVFTAANLGNLGASEMWLGNFAEAREHIERSNAIFEAALGPLHPSVARNLDNLGVLAYEEGRLVDARAYHERALPIYEAALGPDSDEVAYCLTNLANAVLEEGDYAGAQAGYARAAKILEAQRGPEHPDLVIVLNNLGSTYLRQGQFEEAEPYFKRALAIAEAAFGPEHVELHNPLSNLGFIALRLGEPGEALPYLERALAVFEPAFGSDHPGLRTVLLGLGDAFLGLGRAEEAVATYERALSIETETETGDALETAKMYFGLARALSEAGESLPRARAEAEHAAQRFEALEELGEDELAEVRAWLAAHP